VSHFRAAVASKRHDAQQASSAVTFSAFSYTQNVSGSEPAHAQSFSSLYQTCQSGSSMTHLVGEAVGTGVGAGVGFCVGMGVGMGVGTGVGNDVGTGAGSASGSASGSGSGATSGQGSE